MSRWPCVAGLALHRLRCRRLAKRPCAAGPNQNKSLRESPEKLSSMWSIIKNVCSLAHQALTVEIKYWYKLKYEHENIALLMERKKLRTKNESKQSTHYGNRSTHEKGSNHYKDRVMNKDTRRRLQKTKHTEHCMPFPVA